MQQEKLPLFKAVRYLSPDEEYWLGASGHYANSKDGGLYYLSSPEASTVRYMFQLGSADKQYNFLCQAVLRHHINLFATQYKMESTECGRLWTNLRREFDESPWVGNAKYVLPYDDSPYRVVGYDGSFDKREAERLYRDICDSFYVLYEPDVRV